MGVSSDWALQEEMEARHFNYNLPSRLCYPQEKHHAQRTREKIQKLLKNAEDACESGRFGEAIRDSFRAGMLHEGLQWIMDESGNLDPANERRAAVALEKTEAAIAELWRRHAESPALSKESLMQKMAKVEDGKKWGKFWTLKRNYCKGVKFK